MHITTDARSGTFPPTGAGSIEVKQMKKLTIPVAGAGMLLLLAAGVAMAAAPSPSATSTVAPAATTTPVATTAPAATTGTLAAILGLTDAQVVTLRQQGLSLAQIAERQKVDPQRLVDALVAQWSVRIDARVVAGALTADQAKTLKANLAVQAKAMINQVTLGGMRGAAVGAGPNGTLRGAGAAGTAGAGMAGAGRGGMMRGGAAGTGICPVAGSTPAG